MKNLIKKKAHYQKITLYKDTKEFVKSNRNAELIASFLNLLVVRGNSFW